MMKTSDALGPTARALPGTSIGIGCARCVFLETCGGVFKGFDCMTECCGMRDKCKIACPRSPRLGALIADAGGWYADPQRIVRQANRPLPLYVPMLHHAVSREKPVSVGTVAVPLSVAVTILRQHLVLSAGEFRKVLKVGQTAKIIIVGVSTDDFLETFWRDMLNSKFPQRLAALDIDHITSPNFSSAINLPRTASLTNRARILKVSEQLSEAGLSVVPHLNATHEYDWQFWSAFLKDRPDINWVAKEFQTGLKTKNVANWHIRNLDRVQNEIGRALGLVAIGGKGAIDDLQPFIDLSIVDSTPFMKAINRQIWEPVARKWVLRATAEDESVDAHLETNIFYRRQEVALQRARSLQPSPIQLPEVLESRPAIAVQNSLQPSIFPDMYLPLSA